MTSIKGLRGCRPAIGVACVGIVASIAGCADAPSALDPRGPVARALAETWWVMSIGAAAILVLVMVLALYTLLRAPDERPRASGNVLIVGGGVIFPIVTLTALLLYAVQVSGRVQIAHPDALRVEVTGHQWWWEVRYPQYPGAITANEIHIPVGQPVVIELLSADVIHSFWVPQLAGKLDVLPEQRNRLWLQADEAGAYRGQCAEFCGAQHAHMSKLVVAQPLAEFEAWVRAQQQPARAPTGARPMRGQAAFVDLGCNECHAIRGVDTGRRVEHGPDLTHVAARRSLAAATLPNTPEALRAWITNSQAIKPGTHMPSFADADPAAIEDVATFIEGLE